MDKKYIAININDKNDTRKCHCVARLIIVCGNHEVLSHNKTYITKPGFKINGFRYDHNCTG